MNILNYHLTARHAVLATEDAEAFNEYRELYLHHYQPTNNLELDLVEQIVSAAWRLHRAEEIEIALQDLEIDSRADHIQQLYGSLDRPGIWAVGFASLTENSTVFATLQRHQHFLHRRYVSLLRRLEAMRRQTARPLQTRPLRAA
jgi:hypothetical protein